MDTMWRQGDPSEEQTRRNEWLIELVHLSRRTTKQTVLKTCTWLELEAKKVLVEQADRVEKNSLERKDKERREQERLEDLETEMYEQQQHHHHSEEQTVEVGDRENIALVNQGICDP